MAKKERLKTKARPYLVKWPVCGGTAFYTFNTREEAMKVFAEMHFKGNKVQIYKLDMPTEMEVGLHHL